MTRKLPLDHLSIFANEKLGEVPLDITGQNATFLALEKVVQGISCSKPPRSAPCRQEIGRFEHKLPENLRSLISSDGYLRVAYWHQGAQCAVRLSASHPQLPCLAIINCMLYVVIHCKPEKQADLTFPTIHFNLAHHRKVCAFGLSKSLDLLVVSWLLAIELVTREAQDYQTFLLVFIVKFTQFLLIEQQS